jgi:uncharacterized protein YneF (UPF0154 family)
MRSSEGFQGSEVSTQLVREQSALHSSAVSETNGYRRYGLMLLSLVVLAIVIAGMFLYRRSGLRGSNSESPPVASAMTNKLYVEMNQTEQLRFVDEQEQRISAMMGDRPVRLNDEALQAIKVQVDRYAARQDSTSGKASDESLSAIYSRAVPFVPMITRAFAARKIPIVIGIYLPVIESAYRPCYENSIGAKGLFQFLPQTAQQYGVARADMCDVEKMAPAAAHYIADRMAELGDDSQSMTLVLLSYNRGPDGVRVRPASTRRSRAVYTAPTTSLSAPSTWPASSWSGSGTLDILFEAMITSGSWAVPCGGRPNQRMQRTRGEQA